MGRDAVGDEAAIFLLATDHELSCWLARSFVPKQKLDGGGLVVEVRGDDYFPM